MFFSLSMFSGIDVLRFNVQEIWREVLGIEEDYWEC